ncbi:hypothetical protein [Vibrio sp. D431a]|uniref:hypothetical protein n=1 Tax=Vibrio sp. D431a TaxID=2837388 RepID=UPI0025563DE1|nr:hypothetical protein [Vibrio sp. D431a]MDK9793703.1 hypothetical protein [Vibrio sp. D431a]
MQFNHIFEQLDRDLKPLVDEANRINREIHSLRSKANQDLINAYKQSPHTHFDVKSIVELTDEDTCISALIEVVKSRPLKCEEVTAELLGVFTDTDTSQELLEDGLTPTDFVFASLKDDKDKFAFCLHHGYSHGFMQNSKLAREFIEKELVTFSDISAPSRFSYREGCFDAKSMQIAFVIQLTKSDYTNLEDIALSILKLVNNGYKSDRIGIMEYTLAASGTVTLELSEAKNGVFTVSKGRFSSKKFSSGTAYENALSALKHIADNYPYNLD